MKYQSKFILTTTIIMAMFIQGCQNTMQESNDSLKKETIEYQLPMRGNYEEYDPNKDYGPSKASRIAGKLTIKNGCVGLTSTYNGNKILLKFPNHAKFVESGRGVMLADKIYHDGDFVEMMGSGTVREFWKVLPQKPYTPFSKHCTADNYWNVG